MVISLPLRTQEVSQRSTRVLKFTLLQTVLGSTRANKFSLTKINIIFELEDMKYNIFSGLGQIGLESEDIIICFFLL